MTTTSSPTKYRNELVYLESQLTSSLFDSSNLKKAVEKGLQIAENLSQQWTLKDYSGKQRLQYLVFPEGIGCSKQKPIVQTFRINTLFAQIEPQKRLLERNKKSNSESNCSKSSQVNLTSLSSNFLLNDLKRIIDY